MSGIEGLKAGQRAAIKPAADDTIPPVQGEIASIERGRVRLRVSQTSRKNLKDYAARPRCVMIWDDRGRAEQASIQVLSREGDDLVVLPDAPPGKRETVRVRTTAVFTYEVVPPERVQAVVDEIRNAVPDSLDDAIHVDHLWHTGEDLWEKIDEEFSRLTYQLAELNSKMDYLIALAEGRPPEQLAPRYRDVLDFSGAGLGFVENKALAEGSVLRMAIELSRFPRQVAHCLGEVVRCEPRAALGGANAREFTIGVRFTVINEDDRERIIRHVFKMQRRYLRNRKERATEP